MTSKFSSVEEFMAKGFDSDSTDSDCGTKSAKRKKPKMNIESASKKKKLKSKESLTLKMKKGDQSESESDPAEDVTDHKASLHRLKEKDPEFFKFLSENDRNLLNFDVSDDDDDGGTDDEDVDPVKKEKFHKPPKNLQVDSDESDFSAGEDLDKESEPKSGRILISSTLIAEWKKQLETKPKVSILKQVMLAFRAAVEQASEEGSTSGGQFIVKGSTAFNSIVRLCLTNFLPALHKFLRLPPPTVSSNEGKQTINPKKSKTWLKINKSLRSYLVDMVKMLSAVVESEIVVVLLRHILYLVPFFIQYPKHSRLLLKKLVSLWSTSEESVRVVAFLCIIRVLRILPTSYLDYFLKQLYMSYVTNCKFTSPTTWPLINFMKRSLVELYSLDPSLAYQHAFVYIRQLAIHLRNAMTTNKKDAFQAVYNWQYVHCLLLWSHLLVTLHPSPVLTPLVYPLTQVVLGIINLIPTSKYLPLRFHLIRALTKLSAETETFIPVLPLIVQVFDVVNLNKKHSSLSLKPMDFTCILKLSKSQMQENAYRDACIQQVYELLMDYLQTVAHFISYPELVFPASIQMRAFLKNCKVGNYSRQIKQSLDKMEENGKFIEERRKRVSFGISDLKAVAKWEKQCQEEGTPISKYYVSWRKLKDQEIIRAITKNDQVNEDVLPTIDRKKFQDRKVEDKMEFSELFASASEDEENSFGDGMKKPEKQRKKKPVSSKPEKKRK